MRGCVPAGLEDFGEAGHQARTQENASTVKGAVRRPEMRRNRVGSTDWGCLGCQKLLRHSNIGVTQSKYVKKMPEALARGMKLLEAATK